MFILGSLRKFYLYLEALAFDKRTIDKTLPRPKFFTHENGINWIIEKFDKTNFTILEIGSKEVTGKSVLKEKINNAKYIGVDVQDGKNVDIVMDAHELSKKFKKNTIDCIYSSSVFEHLYAPWLVAEEISKILKINGHVCIETHFTYQAHERPFKFYKCSDLGLQVLFNKALGFKVVDSGLDLPLRARFNIHGPKHVRMKELYSAMSHSYYVGKKVNEVNYENFNWLKANPTKEDSSKYYPTSVDSEKTLDFKK